ncbi:hypothetical protein KFK09_018884 [Dendrobium nobile]|uniref:Uncharacterized protein n=1 Tax=Dendrobium nobile TaxID=94219 RepID=A0A8T3AXE5_DENNO|nr:hypothetical protein KFK09_018884 [Dendrobium nobile]
MAFFPSTQIAYFVFPFAPLLQLTILSTAFVSLSVLSRHVICILNFDLTASLGSSKETTNKTILMYSKITYEMTDRKKIDRWKIISVISDFLVMFNLSPMNKISGTATAHI